MIFRYLMALLFAGIVLAPSALSVYEVEFIHKIVFIDPMRFEAINIYAPKDSTIRIQAYITDTHGKTLRH